MTERRQKKDIKDTGKAVKCIFHLLLLSSPFLPFSSSSLAFPFLCFLLLLFLPPPPPFPSSPSFLSFLPLKIHLTAINRGQQKISLGYWPCDRIGLFRVKLLTTLGVFEKPCRLSKRERGFVNFQLLLKNL